VFSQGKRGRPGRGGFFVSIAWGCQTLIEAIGVEKQPR
jgi:hypothetical protein